MPFTIRLSPQLVNQLCAERRDLVPAGEASGILFGLVEEGLVIAQIHRKFSPGIPQEKLLEEQRAALRKDPSTATLQLVGWYAVRESGGLVASDLTFHDRHFPNANDFALILTSEDSANIALELYSRTTNGLLSEEGHRVGLVRLSTAPLESAVEVVLRPKIQDDFFMRAYEMGDVNTEKPADWRENFAGRYPKLLSFLSPNKAEPAPPLKPVKAPDPPPVLESHKPVAPPAKPVRETANLILTPASDQSAAPLARQQQVFTPSPANVPAPSVPGRMLPAESRQLAHTSAEPASRVWIPVTLVFVLTSAITFGGIYFLRTGGNLTRFLERPASRSPLGLKVEAQGQRLLLSWNRENQIVRGAKSGLLLIEDGGHRREVPLDDSSVASGSLLYRPSSEDVTFQLEILGPDGTEAKESTRLLDGATPTGISASPLLLPSIPKTQKKAESPAPGGLSGTKSPTSPAGPRVTEIPPVTGNEKTPAPAREGQPTSNQPAATLSSSTATNSSEKDEVQATPEEQPLKTAATSTQESPLRKSPAESVDPPKTPLPAKTVPDSIATYQPPRPIRQVLPNVSSLPPGVTALAGHLEVVVQVDQTGKVVDARTVSDGRVINSALIAAATSAARMWKFEPAVLRGKAVSSQHSIVFQFSGR